MTKMVQTLDFSRYTLVKMSFGTYTRWDYQHMRDRRRVYIRQCPSLFSECINNFSEIAILLRFVRASIVKNLCSDVLPAGIRLSTSVSCTKMQGK